MERGIPLYRHLALITATVLLSAACTRVSTLPESYLSPVSGASASSGSSSSPPLIPRGRDDSRAQVVEPPNVILIVTDDQRWDTLWAMPNVQTQLADHGVTFSNAFVSNPLCCPSRATILTGNYSHSTGVYQNAGPFGGYPAFNPSTTIATWLDPTYTTALIGKYLNGFASAGQSGYVPPGWDRWAAFAEDNGRYYNYHLDVSGFPGQPDQIIQVSQAPEDYSTTLLGRYATDFVSKTNGPFFLYLTPNAPHQPSVPAPQDHSAFSDLTPWRPPSYEQANMSDKPLWVRQHSPLAPGFEAVVDRHRLLEYQSLVGVDRMVGDVVQALRAKGELANTMIIFTSDNGLMWGEHGLKGKEYPYDESIRVPLVVRYDAVGIHPHIDQHLVVNVDFAPTIAAAAQVQAPAVEGQNFLPLLTDPRLPWRTGFLIEHLQAPDQSDSPSFCGVRTTKYSLISWATGELELYDIGRDPYEMDNLVGTPGTAATERKLMTRLKTLCSPPPPGTSLP